MRGWARFSPVAALLLSPAPPVAAAAPRTHVVIIDKMKFGATPVGVKAGDTIVWDNRDLFRHTATARNGDFSVDLPAGSRGKAVVRTPGTIAFTCRFHPGMRGVLRVSK